MGLEPLTISALRVAEAPHSRLDVRYHQLSSTVDRFLSAITDPVTLASLVSRVGNGVNLPAASYADDFESAGALYVSVGALSQFALRVDACTPLLTDNGVVAGTDLDVESIATRENEVLLTRSGTPGIAWPGKLGPDDLLTIPSGFVIRAQAENWDSVGLAAVLNHPVWRLHSLALSAGKRQDNIGQWSFDEIPIPRLPRSDQEIIAALYIDRLTEIEAISSEDRLASVCDTIIKETLGLELPDMPAGGVIAQVVTLCDVASTRTCRADNRWHGAANQLVRQELLSQAVPLGTMLLSFPSKGRQPNYLDEPDGDGAFAIATANIQMGQVVLDAARPVTAESAAIAPVEAGQLLVAMDGDGSIGKAAVVPQSELSLTRDSHLAVLGVQGGEDAAAAVACWLNSTWGLAQTLGLMTGATGQTQLSPVDLVELLIPDTLAAMSAEIACQFRSALSYIDTPSRRARRLICRASADISEHLLKTGALSIGGPLAAEFTHPDALWNLLEKAYPSVRYRS